MSFNDVLSRVLAVFCLAEQNHLCNFGRGHHEEKFCEIILNLDQQLRRCHLKTILILGPLFSRAKPFVQLW